MEKNFAKENARLIQSFAKMLYQLEYYYKILDTKNKFTLSNAFGWFKVRPFRKLNHASAIDRYWNSKTDAEKIALEKEKWG